MDLPGTINNGRFVVTPDGQRFLVPLRSNDAGPEDLTVVLNAVNGLRK